MSSSSSRMPLIDALKACAAMLVLLNHFSSYGPLAATARDAYPDIFVWLYEYGRMAVQVFLVIAGFLAARGLSREGGALAVSPLPLIWKRYLRLVVPYMAALSLAVIAAAIASQWLDDEAIPERATFTQWLAHLFLVHSLLGFDALSAGVWYIAIDFQLFALMAILLWSGRIRIVAPVLVLLVASLSLLWFNRNPDWDNWAIYFFGSYGLGAAAWWAAERRQMSAWLGAMATIAMAALIVDFRLRIALALGLALLLGFSCRSGLLARWPEIQPFSFIGRISYSIFLVHFPVLLLANGLYARFGFDSVPAALTAMALAGLSSIGLATLFYHAVESPEANRRLNAQAARLGLLTRLGLRRIARRAAPLLRRLVLGRP